MQCIYIYIGFTPSFRWVVDFLYHNKEILGQQHIEIVSEQEFSFFYKNPKYYDIEGMFEKNALHPLFLKLKKCRSALRAGKSLLFFFHTPEPKIYKQFAAMFRESNFFSMYPVKVLVGIGNPQCAFELQFRSETPFAQFYADKTVTKGKNIMRTLSLAARYANLHECMSVIRREWGQESVSLVWSRGDAPVARPDAEHGDQVARWLVCDNMRFLDSAPKHRAAFQSWDGQLLWSLGRIRENVWPEMDEDAYFRHCCALDPTWKPAVATPLSARRLLAERGEQSRRHLETELGIPIGALDGPAWLQTAPQSFSDKTAFEQHAVALSEALPLQVAEPIAQRLAQDICTLPNPDYADAGKVFLLALQGAHSTEGRIGDPLPPVELTVLTMAYNHEKYIAECMESVLAQKTDFPVRHIVLDHCSTDQTPAIIAAYAAKNASIQPVLLAQHRNDENVWNLFSRCRSRYAALCDGDDYFTDPSKLQNQVDFLEKNTDCALCFHPVAVVYESGTKPTYTYPPENYLPGGLKKKYSLSDLFKGNMIQTNSVVYRWRFTEGVAEWFHKELCPGDWYWHLLHAEMGDIGYLPKVMAVYRRHDKALYYHSDNILEHRALYGMSELHCYDIVNRHFKNKYFEELCRLANGVFANFTELKVKNNASIFLDRACDLYPEFTSYFLKSIKIVRGARRHTEI